MKNLLRRNTRKNVMRLSMVAVASMMTTGVHALALDVDNPDLSVRFDNTVKVSAMYRLNDADSRLTDSFRLLVPGVPASAFPQALNFNAGDDNFRKQGFFSQRVDLLSELDVVYKKDFGLRLSGAAWYDDVYQHSSNATDIVNGQNPNNQFPDSTRTMAGNQSELLDAFVFGGWTFGDGQKLTARLGKHALQYGESLFFGDNGIARAQGPMDVNKLLASPNAQFKEIVRPVPQVSAQFQVNPQVSLGGYYQFEWEADRLPPAGSYFSTANVPWGSSQAELVGIPSGPIAGNYVLSAGTDQKPKNSGQFGAQLKWRLDEADLGFYYARYHDKGGQLYGKLNVFNPQASSWYYVFPEDIETVGASVTQTIGNVNFAAEGSLRDKQPLRSTNMLYPSAFTGAPTYATGQTAHVNVSWLASLSPNFLARETSFIGELAWNRVLSTNDPQSELDAGRTRDSTALQFIFSPSYRQVLPGLDVNVPIGLRYTLDGNSSITPWDAKGNGSATLGLEGNYLGVWQFTLNYTHFIGNAVPFVDVSPLLTGGSAIYGQGNALADRDFLAFSLRRTF